MKISQKDSNNEIGFEFLNEGINYAIKDESVNKTEFIAYENITNSTYEIYESNKSYKNNAVYTLVIGVIFIGINIIYGARLWAWPFLIAAPIFYFLFRRSKSDLKVIKTEGSMEIFILKNKDSNNIEETIFAKRNKYLRDNYCEINYQNNPENETSKFLWLKDLGVISNREMEVIKDEIDNV